MYDQRCVCTLFLCLNVINLESNDMSQAREHVVSCR